MAIKAFSWEAFNETPVVGILRGTSKEVLKRIIPIYQSANFSTIEITMNTEGVEEMIAFLAKEFPKLNIGAGTVCNERDLEKALGVGAQFIVMPIIDKNVIRRCKMLNVPVFPGAYTPTEIYQAWRLGASAVKVFPASQLNPKYIKDVLAPFNEVKLIPTGGVSKENITEYFKAGAIGVGMSGSLLPKEMMEAGNENQLKVHLEELKVTIDRVK